MASFKFTSDVPSQGTMFIFSLWVCVIHGEDRFRQFLVDMKPKTSAVIFHSDLNEFIDNLDDLSIHGSATRTEEEFAFGATSFGAATTLLGLDSFQSKVSHS
jgi:hypothetical protein